MRSSTKIHDSAPPFILYSILLLSSIAECGKGTGTHYVWHAGEWGMCWSNRGCGRGVEERVVWCGDAEGNPTPHSSCDATLKPRHFRPCYKKCTGHWELSEWGPCQVRRSAEGLRQELCEGQRHRNVTCRTPHPANLTQLEEDISCSGSKPAATTPCYGECPQDCVVGPWDEWKPCSECTELQHRVRYVIVPPEHGGEPCPSLSEARPCPKECRSKSRNATKDKGNNSPSLSPRIQNKLRVGEWGPCWDPAAQMVETLDIQRNGSQGTESTFLKGHFRLEVQDVLPPSQAQLEDERDEKFPDYISNYELEDQDVGDLPKLGIKERQLSCLAPNSTGLPLSGCLNDDETVISKRGCVLPVDCVVTPWSRWEIIVTGCVAPNGQVVREQRERRRKAVRLHQGEGKPCPHLVERHTADEPSLMPCSSRYQWLVSSWGPCMSTAGPEPETKVTCGGGVQKRLITCVRVLDHTPVHDDMCIHVEAPPRYQRCEVGCERDCVVSAWSPWSSCVPADCSQPPLPESKAYRRRTRDIIVTPSAGGSDCAPLEELSECQEPRCHAWISSDWTPCIVDNPEHTCGSGHVFRNITCLHVNGSVAPIDQCQQELGIVPEFQECQVPCPFDCAVAPWSDWSPCSRPCSSSLDVGYQRRNTSIIAPPGPGGHACVPPDELTEVRTCREEPCGGMSWFNGDWGSCVPENNENCGPGIQRRVLYCVDTLQNKQLPSERCSGLSRPAEERPCEVHCGSNCSLTNWSEWSPCEPRKNCTQDGAEMPSVQTRWRRILIEPSPDREQCGELEQRRTCPPPILPCHPPSWKTSQWSKCRLPQGVTCGTGFRLRGVFCATENAERANITECLLSHTVIPESSQECYVTCPDQCVLSLWSQWEPCPADFTCPTSYSRRRRAILDGTDKYPECRILSLEERRPCACSSSLSLPSSDWSQCILGEVINGNLFRSMENFGDRQRDQTSLEDSLASRSSSINVEVSLEEQGLCGVGSRYRTKKCVNQDGVLADVSSCDGVIREWEPCMIECPADCLVGPWEPWSSCNASCGAGTQRRTRRVVQYPLWSGRECPEREQKRACWGPCDAEWLVEGWNDCQIPDNQECGEGFQTRNVKCVRRLPSGLFEDVSSSLCDPGTLPVEEQLCRIYCPAECVVSPWQEWTECPEGCPKGSHRRRIRTVLRMPSSDASTCPHLQEEEPCLVGISCWQYSWTFSNWTSCIPLGQSSCGEGVKNRPVSCVRSDGVAVPDYHCKRQEKPTPHEKWCYVDCPVDCQVSHWTEWDTSRCSCGEKAGVMTRKRFILVNPSELGRACPAHLAETLPCPVRPCYTWERGDWSPCNLMGGHCGHGTMSRNVTCVGPDGNAADWSNCLSVVHLGGHTWPYLAHALDLNTEDGCYIPCDGECEMTEWSAWSHCHRNCYKGEQGGTQTRSRAILSSDKHLSCPDALWESRPCVAGACLTFSWQVVHGEPVCMRSDGLVVTGGCGNIPRPCVPECQIKGSICSPVGTCVCAPDLLPQHSEDQNGHLVGCLPLNNNTFLQPQRLIQLKYLPEALGGWAFVMMGITSGFVMFILVSIYMVCKSPKAEPEDGQRGDEDVQEHLT